MSFKGYDRIPGYNPPNQYLQIDSSVKAEKVWDSPALVTEVGSSFPLSYDNRRGTVTLPYDPVYTTISVVAIKETFAYEDISETSLFTIGTVDTMNRISEDVLQITFTIDLYTSQVMSYWYDKDREWDELFSVARPVAERLMVKRTSASYVRSYLADGFIPRYLVDSEPVNITARDSNGNDHEVFIHGSKARILVYRCEHDNSMHWIVYYYATGIPSTTTPSGIWNNYMTAWGLTYDEKAQRQFDPLSVRYYGWININPEVLPYRRVHQLTPELYSDTRVYDMTNIIFEDHKFFDRGEYYDYDSTLTYRNAYSNALCCEYSRYSIRDADGSIVYEFPVGTEIQPYTDKKPMFNFDINTPSVTFPVPGYNSTHTFTIASKPMLFLIDNEQVYNVEEKVYQQEMRSQQAMDNLVSGITGAVTTGVTVYGFSRNVGGRGNEGTNNGEREHLNQGDARGKGLLGGGVAMAGAVLGYAYEMLVANPKYAELEDNHVRAQADAVLMASSVAPTYHDKLCGIVRTDFDQTTMQEMNRYQARFGKPSTHIIPGQNLDSISSYIQGEVTLMPGLNKDLENYIVSMFRNGVYFNTVQTP